MSYRSQDKKRLELTAGQQPRWRALLRPSASPALQTVTEAALQLLRSPDDSEYADLSDDELIARIQALLTPEELQRMQRLAETAPDQTIRSVPGMDFDSLSTAEFYRMFLNEIEAAHQGSPRSGGQAE